MRRALVLLLLIPSSAQAAKYTLAQLLERVKAQYPGVVAARESVGAADAQVSQAWRQWAPTGQFTAGFTLVPSVHCERPLFDATGSAILDGNGNPKTVRDENNCISTNINTASVANPDVFKLTNPAIKLDLQLNQPIYTSGKIEAAVGAAKAGRDVARAQVDSAIADATLSAVRAYWGLKWARASAATLDDGRGRIKEWVEKIDKEIDKGTSSYTEQDLFRLKIALDTVELGLLDLRRAERIALAGLRTLCVDPTAEIDDEELDVLEVAERPLGYYEDAASLHRPEARMLDSGTIAVHQLRRLRLAEMLPDLGLVTGFSYSYVHDVDTPNNAFMSHPNSSGFSFALALRQPLDILPKLARLSQARAEERAFAARRREALGGIALEIEKAFADVEVARKRQVLTGHGEKVARGWYNSMNQIEQVGIAASKDLVDSARSYFELRLQHLQAIMDLNVSLAALKRSAGVE